MNILFSFPNNFSPNEKEFQIYCAIKLYKGKYIEKKEAMEICGYDISNKNDNEIFNNNYIYFEKHFKEICGGAYCDTDYRTMKEDEL